MLKPVLFNTEMVKAILDGRKTVTRRVVKPQPKMPICYVCAGYQKGYWGYPARTAYISWGNEYRWPEDMTAEDERRLWNPPCHVDDFLWVRETWRFIPCLDCSKYWGLNLHGCHDTPPAAYEYADVSILHGCFCYRADYPASEFKPWKPSIHMPKEAARIFLRVTEVRAERLQDISDDGAIREGAKKLPCEEWVEKRTEREAFAELWDSTIKPKERSLYSWEANPWVWVIEFEQCEKPKEEYNYE